MRASSILLASSLASCSGGGTSSSPALAAPHTLTYSSPSALYAACAPIASNVPAWSGGAPTAFTIAPTLPVGLELQILTGLISGWPTQPTAAADFTITASNAQGSTSCSVTLAVLGVAPSGLDYPSLHEPIARGFPTDAHLPSLTSGTASTFAPIAGALPAGLALDPASGAITGTPTAFGESSVTIRALNCIGLATTTTIAVRVGWPLAGSVFAVNGAIGTVSRMVTERATGRLHQADYLPGRGDIAAVDIAFSPMTDRAWMLLENGEVHAYLLSADTLQPTPQGAPEILTTGTALDLDADPLGRAVYVLTSDARVHAFAYGADGVLDALTHTTTACGPGPVGFVVDPHGRFLCVATATTRELELYALDDSTGAPVFVTRVNAAEAPTDLAIDSEGRFVYVVDSVNAAVRAFTVDAHLGLLTELVGSPFLVHASSNSRAIALDHVLGRAYVADADTGAIQVFAVGALDGALVPESVALVPAGIRDLVVDSSNGCVYVARTNGSLGQLRFDTTLNALRSLELGEIATQGMPTRLAIAPFGRVPVVRSEALFVTASIDDKIAQLSILPGGPGVVGPMGPPLATGDAPVGLALHPTRNLAYALNGNPAGTTHAFRAYTLGTNGLAPTSTPALLDREGTWLGIEPLGRFLLYVSGTNALGRLRSVEIHPTSSSLLVMSAVASGAHPGHAAIHPSGRWVFVPDAATDSIRRYTYNPRTGALSFEGSTPATLEDPALIAFHPDGIHLYCLSTGAEQVSMFWFSTATGVLQSLSTVPVVVPDLPTDLAVAPDGRHLYVAHASASRIDGFAIDLDPTNAVEDGSLLESPTVTSTPQPFRCLGIEASGRGLFASSADGRVHGYRIESDGSLIHSSSMATGTNGITSLTISTRWH